MSLDHDQIGIAEQLIGAPEPVERFRDRGPERGGVFVWGEGDTVHAPGKKVAAHQHPLLELLERSCGSTLPWLWLTRASETVTLCAATAATG